MLVRLAGRVCELGQLVDGDVGSLPEFAALAVGDERDSSIQVITTCRIPVAISLPRV